VFTGAVMTLTVMFWPNDTPGGRNGHGDKQHQHGRWAHA